MRLNRTQMHRQQMDKKHARNNKLKTECKAMVAEMETLGAPVVGTPPRASRTTHNILAAMLDVARAGAKAKAEAEREAAATKANQTAA